MQESQSGKLRKAFLQSHDGWSTDSVICIDEVRARFLQRCSEVVPELTEREALLEIQRLRKLSKRDPERLGAITTRRSRHNHKTYADAALEAACVLEAASGKSFDWILCDPDLRRQFDSLAQQHAPDINPDLLRLAALGQRKQGKLHNSHRPTPALKLVPGRIYNRRREIHGELGGQQQGGMSTPAGHDVILLFTGAAGEDHGYKDEMKPNGIYWYTGEGQTGDQKFVRSNLALRDHQANGKRAHLFEEIADGNVRYVGEVEYLGHHFENRPGTDGELRQAIVFELGFSAPDDAEIQIEAADLESYSPRALSSMPMHKLRTVALAASREGASAAERRAVVRIRSDAVRSYVLLRASGTCEGCQSPAPFTTHGGTPYLEPHHTQRLADGGPDHPAHVIALCPNCHRRAHYSRDGDDFNNALKTKLREIEPDGDTE